MRAMTNMTKSTRRDRRFPNAAVVLQLLLDAIAYATLSTPALAYNICDDADANAIRSSFRLSFIRGKSAPRIKPSSCPSAAASFRTGDAAR